MDDNEAVQYSKRAHAVANRLHYNREGAEDYAQDALLKTLENPEWKADFRYRVLDAIRTDYGRTGTQRYESRIDFERQKSTDPETLYGPSFERLGDPQSRNPCELKEFRRFYLGLKRYERVILCLRYRWGFSEIEIAECFGFSESRCSQVLKIIHKKVLTNENKINNHSGARNHELDQRVRGLLESLPSSPSEKSEDLVEKRTSEPQIINRETLEAVGVKTSDPFQDFRDFLIE